ncbi:MAG: 3-methyl-2-oxobutanoate hydroxymethyltransferase [Actinomycetaceae bacterium]|nr:3-methyl-2-oxobutanoate hydroxymethyltransferase [Actinomycetaceae bacterium]
MDKPKRKVMRVHHFAQKKRDGMPITMLTAYDAITARICDEAGVDSLLIGDSYGTTYMGLSSTMEVNLEDIVHATRNVARGAHYAFIIADLPFGSYESSPSQAVDSAVQLIKAGAHAVKLEGGVRQAHTIEALVKAGINVCGHIGYTPQSIHSLGGPRIQGRGDQEKCLHDDAQAVDDAGAFACVLEMVPSGVAEKITSSVSCATIGIGAGNATDGQVLVSTDMFGSVGWVPRFVEKFANLDDVMSKAVRQYCDDVHSRRFPSREHSFAS